MKGLVRNLLITLGVIACGGITILLFEAIGFSTAVDFEPLELVHAADPSAIDSELKVWGWNIAAKHLREQTPDFQKAYPRIRPEIQLSGQNAATRFFLSLAAGVGGPDVMQLQSRDGPLYTAMGRLTDLTDLAAPYADSFAPAFWANCVYEERVYGIPWDMGPCGIFYKRSVFEKYGIDPESIETWDDYIAVGERVLKESGGKTKLLNFTTGLQIGASFEILLQQVKGQVFAEDDSIAINSEATLKVLRLIRKLLASKAYSNLDTTMPEFYSTFNTDTVACYMSGSWFGGILRVYGSKMEGGWGIMRLPAFEAGGLRASNVGGSIMVIPNQSENKEAAWRFIEYMLCRREGQLASYRNNDLFPTMLDVMDDPFFEAPDPFYEDQKVRSLLAQDIEKIPELRRTQYWLEANDIISQRLSEWVNSKEAPEPFLERLETQLSLRLSMPVSKNSLSASKENRSESYALREEAAR